EHAAQRKQTVKPRRRHHAFGDERTDRVYDGGELGAVDLGSASAGLPLELEVGGHGAAAEALLHRLAHAGLQRVEAIWQAHAQIKPSAIDALDLPRPGNRAPGAFSAGETGHAGKGHGASSMNRPDPSLYEVLGFGD